MSERSVAALAVVVLLVVGALTVPVDVAPLGAADAAHTATTDSIYVAATGDYGYSPDTFEEVPTNATITVTFVDNSTMVGGHTFTIIGEEGVQIPTSDTATQIDNLAYGNNPPALFNSNVSAYGDRNISTFQSPGPGWYEFVCTVASHFQNGMYGFIAFGMKLPSNLTLPSSVGVGGRLSFSPIDAVVIGALVVVFVLGYLVWRRRRSALRMPPEAAKHPKTESTETREVEVGREKGAG